MSYKLHLGNCVDVLFGYDDDSIDAIVTDPPYGLEFMGKDWDAPWKSRGDNPAGAKFSEGGYKESNGYANRKTPAYGKAWQNKRCTKCGYLASGGSPCECEHPEWVMERGNIAAPMQAFQVWCEVWARECLRVLKPGGHLLAFGGSRTYHRMACAIEDAGFEIRDQIMWLYGCLSDDTEILVDGEWVSHKCATEGRCALAYDKDQDTFAWRRIEQKFEYTVCDTAFRIQSDTTDQIVSRNHRCLVEREGALVFESAEEVARQRDARVPVLENMRGLLDSLPYADEGTSGQKQNMQTVWTPPPLCATTPHTQVDEPEENDAREVRRMSSGGVETHSMVETCDVTDMFPEMQRGATERRVDKTLQQGSGGLDRFQSGIVSSEDDRREQSCVEGRRDLFSQARELQTDQIRAVPVGISWDGPEGWVCDGAQTDRGSDTRQMPSQDGSGASRYTRSTEQRSEDFDAVSEQPRSQTIRASRFTRTDLARIEPFHYEGVIWCVRVPTGAFVARRNGKVFITGNSGFPKSLDVGKAIDKSAGIEREVVGSKFGLPGYRLGGTGGNEIYGKGLANGSSKCSITAPATEESTKWNGFGTALKPAHEPIVLARKPLTGTVAANVLQHGTGALNIDACRVPGEAVPINRLEKWSGFGQEVRPDYEATVNTQGRWPANVIHDGSDEVLAAFPITSSGAMKREVEAYDGESTTSFLRGRSGPSNQHGDSGSAARFFQTCRGDEPSANRTYEDSGATNFAMKPGARREPETPAKFFYTAKVSKKERQDGLGDLVNNHPTLKPISLMRYLCRLVTPPGGTVLDPFMGSGSTGKAALLEGFNFVGIEKDPGYYAIAERRVGSAAGAVLPSMRIDSDGLAVQVDLQPV